jgi:hypothetical protein
MFFRRHRPPGSKYKRKKYPHVQVRPRLSTLESVILYGDKDFSVMVQFFRGK